MLLLCKTMSLETSDNTKRYIFEDAAWGM